MDMDHVSYMDSFCPPQERLERVREHVVHPLERDREGQPRLLIQRYRRPAAGSNFDVTLHHDKRRSIDVLHNLVSYLINEVLGERLDWTLESKAYGFLSDRLRAVRQDLLVQQREVRREQRAGQEKLEIEQLVKSTSILATSTRFLLLANYLLCEKSRLEFEAKLNYNQLLESLKDVLNVYRERPELRGHWEDELLEMATVYILLNIGTVEAVDFALNLDEDLKRSTVVSTCLRLTWAFMEGNYVRMFRLLPKLPLITQLALHFNLGAILSKFLLSMNIAYSSLNCRYPVSALVHLVGLEDEQRRLVDVCHQLNIKVEGEVVCFHRSRGAINAVKPFRVKRLDSLLDQLIAEKRLGQLILHGIQSKKQLSQSYEMKVQ